MLTIEYRNCRAGMLKWKPCRRVYTTPASAARALHRLESLAHSWDGYEYRLTAI